MTECSDFRSQTCCFTGHQDLEPWEESKVLTRLRYLLMPMLAEGVRFFGVGGARGFDRLAAEYLLDLRDRDKQTIRVISVLPFPDYREGWSEEDFRRQEEIIRRSDKVAIISPEKITGAYLARDRRLVDESSRCICYCHRQTGGTAYTVRYAMKQGIPVHNTSSWDLRQLQTK